MMRLRRSILLAALAASFVLPSAFADWGDWSTLVEEAKVQLGKTKEAISDAADSIKEDDRVTKLKKMWDGLEINARLRYAFGDDIDPKSALTGYFFDLKRPIPNAKDSKGMPVRRAKPGDMPGIVREFMERDWDSSVFARYYSPEVKLLAPYFYLPRCKAEYAPLAFQCDEAKNAKTVKPSCWVVLYQGVVTAPKSGKFRFVGMCDDTMIVRFNRKKVLEYGWYIPSEGDSAIGTSPAYQQKITTREKDPAALYSYESTPHWNRHLKGVASGSVFEVKKGEKYPIEILLSEIPGCEFGFVLLIEEVTGEPNAGYFQPWESPKLQLFRTNGTLPEEERIREALGDYMVGKELECPPFDEKKSLIWAIDSEETEKAGFWERLLGDLPDKDSETAMGTKEK